MPQTRSAARTLNPLSNARQLVSVVREVSFDALHDAAVRDLRVAVISSTREEARHVAIWLFGDDARTRVVALGEDESLPKHADLVLYDYRLRNVPMHSADATIAFNPFDDLDRVRQRIVQSGDDRELALGRTFPALREVAARHAIMTTSRVNAQFALASNIPALVPVVGGVLSAGADTIVLTKNQLMLIFKLAAIHGQNIDNRWRIYQEMMPVVGAGLAWRNVARSLASLLPFAAGAVPKVAIAYAGTFVAGMAAHIYYSEGTRANADRIRGLYQQALSELRSRPALISPLHGRRHESERDAESRSLIDVPYRSDGSSAIP